MTINHNYYLNLAFQLAETNLGFTKLNPCVGSIVVKNGSVISSAVTSKNGRPHSEYNALNKLKIKKLSIFTPYTDQINQSVIEYFKKENIEISELSYFDIASDIDIGRVDPDHLYEVMSKQNLSKSDALFVSCTALPVLSIIKDLEKKLGKIVLSSNQTLIWDTLNQIDYKNKIEGYGELFNN